MSSTDNRIVKMQFDNATFKKEALATKDTLAQVDAAVAKAGKGRGLLDMAGHMETVKVKAGAMQVAAVTAIANIANRAVNAGIQMAKSFTLDPIKQGFDEYELKMKSIQTILANTKGENLKSVSAALAELNTYADKTIYNFANMTENIGKLTTAGISLEDSTAVVKGFSNMVALAGGDATAAAGAMEQFGQGLQAGAIKAIDWMSISNRGLGSQNLQKAFFETARAAGDLADVPLTTSFEEWSKQSGGFKNSLESGWLTTDVATKTLKIMTGDMQSVEELMKQGFSEQAAKDLIAIANNALDSATKVRTFSAFMDTTKEALASGWGQVMEIIFGDFNESTKLFTMLSEKTGSVINMFFGYLTRLLTAFDKLGGRNAILETMKNILSPIVALVGLLAKGFKLAFGGGETGRGLATFAKALQHATRPLRLLGQLISGQITPFEFFARLIQVVVNGLRNLADYLGGPVKGLADLVNIKLPSGDGIFAFFDRLVGILKSAGDQFEKLRGQGKSVMDALSGISFSVPSMPGLPNLPDVSSLKMPDIGGVFDKGSEQVTKMADAIDLVNRRMSEFSFDATPVKGFIGGADAADLSVNNVAGSMEKAETVGDRVMPAITKTWEWLKNLFSNFNLEDLMASINLAVLSTMGITFSQFMKSLSDGISGLSDAASGFGGLMEGVKDSLGGFAAAAKRQAMAAIILNVAIAIGIMAASLWVLSKIPMEDLTKAMLALGGIALVLKFAIDAIVEAMSKLEGKGTVFKMGALSFTLISLGLALIFLATAFLIFNKVSWESLLKGLITITVIMFAIQKIGDLGEGASKNIFAAGFAIGAIAVSLLILAGALMLFQLVKWEAIAKAGVVLGGMALVLGVLAMVPYGGIEKVGLAMLAASAGLLIMANALIIFAAVKWESIGKAAVIIGVLALAIGALMLLGGGPVGAAAFVAIAGAMVLLAGAGLMLNKVDWESIGKIALIMAVLIGGFTALLAVVTFFAPAIILMSAFAGSIALLAVALALFFGALALILPLLALGVGAFAAFGTGAAVAIGVFLTTLALQAPIMKKSILKIMQVAIDGIVEGVPMIIQGFKDLWEAIKKEFSGGGGGKGGGGVEASVGKSSQGWMDKIGDTIKKYMPKIVAKAVELGGKFIDGLTKRAPAIAAKGVELIIGLIQGIASKAEALASAAVDLIIKLAEGIGKGTARMARAGIALIAQFLHDLASAIRNGGAAIGSGLTDVLDAMRDVGVDMVKGLIGGIQDMFGDAMAEIGNLAEGMIGKARSILKIFSPSRVFRDIGKFLVEGLTGGIQSNAAAAITSVASMMTGTIATANSYVDKFVQELDQKALAATAKAAGLQAAAEKAAKAAEKTKKNKKDDRAANKLQQAANQAARQAEKREQKAADAAEARQRAIDFEEASLIDQAKMRSEDATNTLDDAKAAEFEAESKRQQAQALREQAKKKGVSDKDAKAFRKEAERLEAQAKKDAQRANSLVGQARNQAAQAMELQRLAAAAAVADWDKRWRDEAAADKAADDYEKMTDEAKIAENQRRAQAAQEKADADLARAKILAYTDIDAANELAEQALEGADQARDYLREAERLRAELAQKQKEEQEAKDQQSTEVGGDVVNLDPTEAAAIAMGNYANTYDAAYAAAAGGQTVQFNQYNNSPEAISAIDAYRYGNNQLAFAASKLNPAA